MLCCPPFAAHCVKVQVQEIDVTTSLVAAGAEATTHNHQPRLGVSISLILLPHGGLCTLYTEMVLAGARLILVKMLVSLFGSFTPIQMRSRTQAAGILLRHSLTAYDAAYVALAEALASPLITRDGRMASAHGHHAKIQLVA